MRTRNVIAAVLIPAAILAATGPAAAQQTDYPVTIENGDHTLTVDAPPERAVSLNGHTTELMLSLGLADRMVGTAYLNHPILDHLEADYETIPMLSDGTGYPSLEVLLGVEADFTYGRDTAYRDTAVGTVERLGEMGIDAYAVKGTLIQGATMDDVYEDIRNLGVIFDIQSRAAELIAEIEADIDAVRDVVAEVETPVAVLVYDSGHDGIFTTGQALQTSLIELAGGRNVFDDIDDTWATVSWEEAVASEPDIIVINDYGQTSAEAKIAMLRERPALAGMPAIQNDRFVVLPLPSAFEGVRNADAVRTLATGFYPDLFR